MFGNAFAQKRGDIRRGGYFLQLRQAGEIELLRDIAFGNRRGRDISFGSRHVTVRLLRLLLALRPPRKKALVLKALAFVALVRTAHTPPFPSLWELSGIR